MEEALGRLPLEDVERAVSRSVEMGAMAFKKKEWERAFEFYSTVIAGLAYLKKNDEVSLSRAFSNRSACRLQMSDLDGAREDAEACVELLPTWQKGWYRLGRAQFSKGDSKSALRSFDEALRLDPSNRELINWREKALKKVDEDRAIDLKKKRYATDYSKFDEIAEAARAPAQKRTGPVVETIEEMHDLLSKQQQALIDNQPATIASFSSTVLRSRQQSDEVRDDDALGGLVHYLAQSSALEARKRRIDAKCRLDLPKVVKDVAEKIASLGGFENALALFVGCSPATVLAASPFKVRAFGIEGPFMPGEQTVIEDCFLDNEEEAALVLVLDDAVWFDAGLGRALPFVRHCRRHLCAPRPIVLPRRARVLAAPAFVETPEDCGLRFDDADDEYRWHFYPEKCPSNAQLLAPEQEIFSFDFDAEDIDAALPLDDSVLREFAIDGKSNAVCFRVALTNSHTGGEEEIFLERSMQYVDAVEFSGDVEIRCWHNSTRLSFEFVRPLPLAPRIYRAALARWHFDMVADHERNEAFRLGLSGVVEGLDVVDFGSGTGLLSFLAAKEGARSVVGFETQSTLCELSRKLAARNSCSETCRFVNKDCRQMIMGKDLKKKADVLVMELFDYGCLGEGALHLAHFAWNTCLKESGRIVPDSATIYAQLVELENPVFSPDYYGLDLQSVDHKKISSPFEVFHFDFNDRVKMKSTPPTKGECKVADVAAERDGVVNAVVFWHRLDLGNNDAIISTQPGARSCWVQACQPLPDLAISRGEIVPIKASHQGSRCTFSYATNSNQRYKFDPRWLAQYNDLVEKSTKLEKTLAFNSAARQQAIDSLISIAIDPARFARHGFYIDAAKAQEFAMSFFVSTKNK